MYLFNEKWSFQTLVIKPLTKAMGYRQKKKRNTFKFEYVSLLCMV